MKSYVPRFATIATTTLGLALGLSGCGSETPQATVPMPPPANVQPATPPSTAAVDNTNGSQDVSDLRLRPGAQRPTRTSPYLAKAPRITGAELKARMDSGEKTIVVDTTDVDTPVKVKGAVSVREPKIEEWSKTIPKTTYIVAYCGCPDDQAAARATLTLREDGFDQAYVLRGGIEEWEGSGYPTTGSRPKQ